MSNHPDTSADYCYRHPDRQSYILCQRCGRTICPECQTPGAVGVFCPECMKEQRASAPKTKPAILTRLSGRGAPVVTYSIIALNVVLFIGQQIPGLGLTAHMQYAGIYALPQFFEPWRIFTSMFAHGSILHIALNMYTLWIFGQLLEGLLGRGRYLTLYLISGFAGGVGVIWLADPRVAVIGASGAIFGLMGAFLVIQRRLGGQTTQLFILVGINLVIGFIPGFNVAWQAHVGGLIGGVLIGLIYMETRNRSRRLVQIALLVALCIVLIALSLRYFYLPLSG